MLFDCAFDDSTADSFFVHTPTGPPIISGYSLAPSRPERSRSRKRKRRGRRKRRTLAATSLTATNLFVLAENYRSHPNTSDNPSMTCFTCARSTIWRDLSRAAAKAASAKFRQIRLAPTSPMWAQRAEVCERCPLRFVRQGKSYCGRPFLSHMERDASVEGCGCPTHDKAKDPSEHCPLTPGNYPASHAGVAGCDCKWCAIAGATRSH